MKNDNDELKYLIIFEEYSKAFESLEKNKNTVTLTSTEYEYALGCYIDIGTYNDYEYLDKFLGYYFDFEEKFLIIMILLLYYNNNSFNYMNCNDIYQIGLQQYKTNFGLILD